MLIYMHRYEVVEALEAYLSKSLGANPDLFSVVDVDFQHVKLTFDEATGKTNTSDRQLFEFEDLLTDIIFFLPSSAFRVLMCFALPVSLYSKYSFCAPFKPTLNPEESAPEV
mgnify:CR=1 FL=1